MNITAEMVQAADRAYWNAQGKRGVRDMRSALEAALAAAPTSATEPVEIKHLTWRAYGNQHVSGWQGQGSMGYLCYVTKGGPDGEEGWWCDDEVFDTADEAKTAAQSDFEARIRSALVTSDKG